MEGRFSLLLCYALGLICYNLRLPNGPPQQTPLPMLKTTRIMMMPRATDRRSNHPVFSNRCVVVALLLLTLLGAAGCDSDLAPVEPIVTDTNDSGDSSGDSSGDNGDGVNNTVDNGTPDTGNTNGDANGDTSNNSGDSNGDTNGDNNADNGSNQNTDSASAIGGYAFALSNTVFSLPEGDSITIVVAVARDEGHVTPIQLSANPATASDNRNLSLNFASNTLNPGTNSTALTIALDYDAAPLLPQQRAVVLRASDGATVTEQRILLDIQPTDAPDVYLLIGQSNMVGFSEDNSRMDFPGGPDEPNARILQLNVTGNDFQNFDDASAFSNPDRLAGFPTLIEAQHPLHVGFDPSINGKNGDYIGMGLSFGKAALPNTSTNIVLVPAAWSGTGFCLNNPEWLAWNSAPTNNTSLGGTALFERAVARANLALSETGGILRGILWHQGEADSTNITCANAYSDNLFRLARALRENIQPDLRGAAGRGPDALIPFVVGTMSRGNDARGDFDVFDEPKSVVDAVHRGIESLVSHAAFSNNDDLVPPAFDCGESSCIHFGADAYREMGQRYYQELQNILAR